MASDPVKALRNLLDALDRYGLADHPWMAEVMSEARAAIAPAPPPETREARPICGGCAVTGLWEHRCHGAPCPCQECVPPPSPSDEETNR
jgi:hypothetical protein